MEGLSASSVYVGHLKSERRSRGGWICCFCYRAATTGPQPLFTVYSPDLVSSEQEYLLARRSQATFSKDAQGMDVEESGWLLQATEERLLQFGVSPQFIAGLNQSGNVQRFFC